MGLNETSSFIFLRSFPRSSSEVPLKNFKAQSWLSVTTNTPFGWALRMVSKDSSCASSRLLVKNRSVWSFYLTYYPTLSRMEMRTTLVRRDVKVLS